MNVSRFFCICLSILVLLSGVPLANAAANCAQVGSTHVIVLPLDYVDWRDFTASEYPAFQQMARLGAVGLANMNTGNGHGMWNEYTSMSVGEPVRFTPLSPLMTCAQIPVDWFHDTLQRKRTYGLGIGGLSQSIRDAGLVTAYIGTQKVNKTTFHPAGMFVIDKQGKIPFYTGRTSDSYSVPDTLAPAGVRDSVQKLIVAATDFLHGKSGLLVIGMGDLIRVEQEHSHISTSRYEELRKQALIEVNRLIQGILKQLSDRDTLLVMAVTPTPEQVKTQEKLGPVAMIGRHVPGGGILTSKTTRQQGIVANLDIVPTILQQLEIPSAQTLGHPLEVQTAGTVLNQQGIAHEDQNLRLITQKLDLNTWYTIHRSSILRGIAGVVAVILLGCLARILGWLPKRYIKTPLLQICSGCCLLPTMFLLLGTIHRLFLLYGSWQWVNQAPVSVYVVCVILLTAGCSWTVLKIKYWNGKLLYLSSLMLVTYGILLLLHDGTFAQSLLGYDPVNGARYYGIGNEYMAGFVAAWFLFVAAVIDIFGKRVLVWGWIVSGLFVLYLASPVYGANIGGAVTVGLGSALLLYRIQAGYWKKSGWFVMAGAVVATTLLIGMMQEIPYFPESHAGAMIRLLERREWNMIGLVINRKIHMNLNMLLISPFWLSVGIFAALGTASVLIHHPLYKRWKQEQHPFYQVILSGIIAAVIGYLVNDSGIIVSLLLLYPILFVLLGWMNDGQPFDRRLLITKMMCRLNKWRRNTIPMD